MIRFILNTTVVLCMLCTVVSGSEASSPPPEKISFEMRFKDLSESDDKSLLNISWSYGESMKEKTPFLEGLGIPEGNLRYLCNPNLKGFEWVALEMKEGKPAALHIDLDADGTLSSGETLTPLQENLDKRSTCEFLTPQFGMTTTDGDIVPYKMLCKAIVEKSGYAKIRWTPYCFWRGEAQVDDRVYRFSLYDFNGNGIFHDFGKDNYELATEGADRPATPWKRSLYLSSLILWNDQYYRLYFSGKEAEEGNFIAALLKDTSPVGEWSLELAGGANRSIIYCMTKIRGKEDRTVVYQLSGMKHRLPAKEFIIEDANMSSNNTDGAHLQVNFVMDSGFTIKPDETCTTKIGDPRIELKVHHAIDRQTWETYVGDPFPLDATLQIDHETIGCSNEVYKMFSVSGSKFTMLEPQVRIVDPNGKEVVSAPMSYG